MSRNYTAIDLSQLPPPNVVEPLDYEIILSELTAEFREKIPEFNAIVESDPAYKLLETFAYRELLLRQRINDAARSVMLAYAQRSDLDHIAANFGIQRIVIQPGNPEANPPISVSYEDDNRFRKRIQLSLEGYTCAGSEGSYVFYTLTASDKVKDVHVYSPTPGEVRVVILSTEGDGTPSQALLDVVQQKLNADEIRPLTDHVIVEPAEIIHYTLNIQITVDNQLIKSVVKETVMQRLQDYTQKQHCLGGIVSLSGLYAACHVEGVNTVTLNHQEDLCASLQQALYLAPLDSHLQLY